MSAMTSDYNFLQFHTDRVTIVTTHPMSSLAAVWPRSEHPAVCRGQCHTPESRPVSLCAALNRGLDTAAANMQRSCMTWGMQHLSEERLNVCPSWCKYVAIKIEMINWPFQSLRRRRGLTVRKKGLVCLTQLSATTPLKTSRRWPDLVWTEWSGLVKSPDQVNPKPEEENFAELIHNIIRNQMNHCKISQDRQLRQAAGLSAWVPHAVGRKEWKGKLNQKLN